MPLRNIKERFDQIAAAKKEMERLRIAIKQIRIHSDYIVLCPKPTGINWLGISNATKGLFGSSVLEIQHYYSKSILDSKQNLELTLLLADADFKQVIASGNHGYFLDLLAEIHHLGIKTGIIFHGALSELSESEERVPLFSEIINRLRNGKINKVGFIKKSLSETFYQLVSPNSYPLNLTCHVPIGIENNKANANIGKLNIAIPGGNNFNKNVQNQVAAALLIPETYIHVWDPKKNLSFWNADDRIIPHPHSNHSVFLRTLAQCDAALYLSFSESWGQVITESLALGIPCLSSDNNGIFDEDLELKKLLVVSANDNPIQISIQLKQVLALKDELRPALISHIEKLNHKSVLMKNAFLNG